MMWFLMMLFLAWMADAGRRNKDRVEVRGADGVWRRIDPK